MHLTYFLTCCFKFLLNIFLVNSKTILSKQVLWTEAAFSACLAWHWPDHHWQCNWRVAWTSLRMCADKRRTLRATIVTIFSHMTRGVSFLSNMTRFLDCFFGNYHDFQTSNFRKVVWQHTEGTVRSIIWILLEIYLAFQQWTNFENPLRIYKSYRHKFGVLLFWDTVYTRKLVSTSLVEHSINCWCLRLHSHCTGTRGMRTERSKIGCLTKSTDWRNQWLN